MTKSRSKWLFLVLALCVMVCVSSVGTYAQSSGSNDQHEAPTSDGPNGQFGAQDQASEAVSQTDQQGEASEAASHDGQEGQVAEAGQVGDQGHVGKGGEAAEQQATANDIDNDRMNDMQLDLQEESAGGAE